MVIGLKIEIEAPKEALEMAEQLKKPFLFSSFEIIQGSRVLAHDSIRKGFLL